MRAGLGLVWAARGLGGAYCDQTMRPNDRQSAPLLDPPIRQVGFVSKEISIVYLIYETLVYQKACVEITIL